MNSRDMITGFRTDLARRQTETMSHADSSHLNTATRQHVRAAFQSLNDAVNAADPAHAAAERIRGDHRLNVETKRTEIASHYAQARATAEEHLTDAETAIGRATGESAAAMRPGMPSTASQAEVLDRKADLIRLLDNTPGSELGQRIASLITNARTTAADSSATSAAKEDARLTGFVLGGGALDLYVAARGDASTPLVIAQALGSEQQRDFHQTRLVGNPGVGSSTGAGSDTLSAAHSLASLIVANQFGD